jgi:hypothetical protein
MRKRSSYEPGKWLVIELCRVQRGEHGERLKIFPLSKNFPTREEAEKQLPLFSPKHGGQLHVVPDSYPQKEKPARRRARPRELRRR